MQYFDSMHFRIVIDYLLIEFMSTFSYYLPYAWTVVLPLQNYYYIHGEEESKRGQVVDILSGMGTISTWHYANLSGYSLSTMDLNMKMPS